MSQTKLRVIAAKSKYLESVCLQKQNLKLFVCWFTSISCSCITISGNQINPHFSFLPLLKSALVDNIYWYNLKKKENKSRETFLHWNTNRFMTRFGQWKHEVTTNIQCITCHNSCFTSLSQDLISFLFHWNNTVLDCGVLLQLTD